MAFSNYSLKEGENVMRILITLRRRRTHRYLINLFAKAMISQVRGLIGNQEYAKALDLVYQEGLLEKEVADEELPGLKTDLMLSERSANWDLKR